MHGLNISFDDFHLKSTVLVHPRIFNRRTPLGKATFSGPVFYPRGGITPLVFSLYDTKKQEITVDNDSYLLPSMVIGPVLS